MLKNISRIIIISFFVFSCASQKSSMNEKKADLFFGKGTNNLIKGDYTSALDHLIKASKLAPKRSDIHNNLGMAYYMKKSKRNALKHIKHSIKLDKNNTEAKSNLASIYLEAGKLDKASKFYRSILKDLTYQKHFKTYYNLGIISLKKNNVSNAKSYFKKSVAENNYSCNALYQLGMMSLKQKQYNEASNYFYKGTDGPCYNMEANHYYLGISYEKLGKIKEAIKTHKLIGKQFKQSKYYSLSQNKVSTLSRLEESGIMFSQGNSNNTNY